MVRQVRPQLWVLSRVPSPSVCVDRAGLTWAVASQCPRPWSLPPAYALVSSEGRLPAGAELGPGLSTATMRPPDSGGGSPAQPCLLAASWRHWNPSATGCVTHTLLSLSMCVQHRSLREPGGRFVRGQGLAYGETGHPRLCLDPHGASVGKTERKKEREERQGGGGRLQPVGGETPAGCLPPEVTAGPASWAAASACRSGCGTDVGLGS